MCVVCFYVCFFSSRRRHTRCALVTGVQTCALPILFTADAPGSIVQRDIGEDYVARIASDVQIDRPLKIVVDAGNGVAGVLGPRVLKADGATVVPLFCEIDGPFHNPNAAPSKSATLHYHPTEVTHESPATAIDITN